jgi:FAD/FMN-containing dehydrogenase
MGLLHKNDVAVPISSMPLFLEELEELIASRYGRFDVLLFGHIGDGNIHVNVIDRSRMPEPAFRQITDELDVAMCALIRKFGGSVSAEHGIGLLKKKLLHLQRSETEIELMKKIKRSLDPKNLFNPGKIIDW